MAVVIFLRGNSSDYFPPWKWQWLFSSVEMAVVIFLRGNSSGYFPPRILVFYIRQRSVQRLRIKNSYLYSTVPLSFDR